MDEGRAKEWVARGVEYYGAGKLEKAVSLWEQALELDPTDREAQEYLSYVRDNMYALRAQFRDTVGEPGAAPTHGAGSQATEVSVASTEAGYSGSSRGVGDDWEMSSEHRSLSASSSPDDLDISEIEIGREGTGGQTLGQPELAVAVPHPLSADDLELGQTGTGQFPVQSPVAIAIEIESESESEVEAEENESSAVKGGGLQLGRWSADGPGSEVAPANGVGAQRAPANEDAGLALDPAYQDSPRSTLMLGSSMVSLDPVKPAPMAMGTPQFGPGSAPRESESAVRGEPTLDPVGSIELATPLDSVPPPPQLVIPSSAPSDTGPRDLDLELEPVDPEPTSAPVPVTTLRGVGALAVDAEDMSVREGLLAELAKQPMPEEADETTKLRVGWLIAKAIASSGSGAHEMAVEAANLALEENPASAAAQRVVHDYLAELAVVYRASVGGASRFPALTRPLHELAAEELDPRGVFLLSRIDGTLSFEDILDISGMQADEAWRLLATMVVRGILESR